MENKFWTLQYWKNIQKKFIPNKKEQLDSLVMETANRLTLDLLNQNQLSNKEIGYVLIELNVVVKQRLENRKKLLEKELIETVEVLNLI